MPYSSVSLRKRWKKIIPKLKAHVAIYARGRIISTPPINEFPKNEDYLYTPPCGNDPKGRR